MTTKSDEKHCIHVIYVLLESLSKHKCLYGEQNLAEHAGHDFMLQSTSTGVKNK